MHKFWHFLLQFHLFLEFCNFSARCLGPGRAGPRPSPARPAKMRAGLGPVPPLQLEQGIKKESLSESLHTKKERAQRLPSVYSPTLFPLAWLHETTSPIWPGEQCADAWDRERGEPPHTQPRARKKNLSVRFPFLPSFFFKPVWHPLLPFPLPPSRKPFPATEFFPFFLSTFHSTEPLVLAGNTFWYTYLPTLLSGLGHF